MGEKTLLGLQRTLKLWAGLALFATGAFAMPAQFGLSPDNSQGLLLQTIRSARTELQVNIYEFESEPILQALLDRIDAGVTVDLLIEAEPLGNMTLGSKDMIRRLHTAMRDSGNPDHRIYLMRSGDGDRRYVYDHGKYVIVDQARVLITSENFKGTGHPDPGKIGNRGWETVLSSPAFAGRMLDMFYDDADPSYGDVEEVGPLDSLRLPAPIARPEDEDSASDQIRPAPTLPVGDGVVSSARLITSPDSLAPLRTLIRSATTRLELEHMSMPSTWRDDQGKPVMNPLIAEAIEAAKRGVQVRVLLNDDRAFDPKPKPGKKYANDLTVDAIQQAAACEDLPLQARIVDLIEDGITYIHNKGMLVDDDRALVSSINGTKNSVKNNREVAVLLDSRDANAYFSHAFDFDWNVSEPPQAAQVNPAACPPTGLLGWLMRGLPIE
jgi:phosphatidylserine/phosphatidylglycerophosphate/cardiolipin synthase-like enzyme